MGEAADRAQGLKERMETYDGLSHVGVGVRRLNHCGAKASH